MEKMSSADRSHLRFQEVMQQHHQVLPRIDRLGRKRWTGPNYPTAGTEGETPPLSPTLTIASIVTVLQKREISSYHKCRQWNVWPKFAFSILTPQATVDSQLHWSVRQFNPICLNHHAYVASRGVTIHSAHNVIWLTILNSQWFAFSTTISTKLLYLVAT